MIASVKRRSYDAPVIAQNQKEGFDHESGVDFNHHPDCAAFGQRSDMALQSRLGLSSERHLGDNSSHRSDTGPLETNLKKRSQESEYRSQKAQAKTTFKDFLSFCLLTPEF
jgi:hypothetical protein